MGAHAGAGERAKRYRNEPVPDVYNIDPLDLGDPYAKETFMETVPIIALAGATLLLFLAWSILLCCTDHQASGEGNACSRPVVLQFGVVVLLCANGALTYMAVGVDDQILDAFDRFKPAVAFANTWQANVASSSQAALEQATETAALATAMRNAANADLSASLGTMAAGLANVSNGTFRINRTVAGYPIDLGVLQDSHDSADVWYNPRVRYYFYAMMALAFVVALWALGCTCCPSCSARRKSDIWTKILMGVLTWTYTILVVCAFVVAAVALFGTTLLADVCLDFDTVRTPPKHAHVGFCPSGPLFFVGSHHNPQRHTHPVSSC